jgi:membrane protease subunit HflK
MTIANSPEPTPQSPLDGVTRQPRPARVVVIAVCLLLTGWLMAGFYVVGADEAAVVRVCGRAQRTDDGTVRLQSSGLHYHLPWPLVQIDRVRINEVRTVTIGSADLDDVDSGEFLKAIDPSRQSQFLVGNRNVLHVNLNVHYRISRERIDQWLYGSTSSDQRLQLLAGAVLADVVLRCGVDFVHTLGHSQIRQAVLSRLREVAESSSLGVEIEDVTIAGVAPPIRVKAEFVDVMNARADRETYINRARAYAEQKQADAVAEASKRRNEAEGRRLQVVQLAAAEADSFDRMIDQFEQASATGPLSYAEVRQLAMQRHFIETLEHVYRNVEGKVFLDSGKPVDITIHRNPNQD